MFLSSPELCVETLASLSYSMNLNSALEFGAPTILGPILPTHRVFCLSSLILMTQEQLGRGQA